MTTARFTIFILGLAAIVAPARASLTYQSSQSTWTTVVNTDSLTASGLFTFMSTDLASDGNVCTSGPTCTDEYIDATDGVEFIGFNGSGSENAALSVTAGVLTVQNDSADSIEIVFTGVYGFGFNFTTDNNADNLCVGTTVSDCSGGPFFSNGNSVFAGALNNNPTPPAALPSIWLHSLDSGDTNIQSYEIASQASESDAPDAATGLTLGAGLLLIAGYHRRAHSLGSNRR